MEIISCSHNYYTLPGVMIAKRKQATRVTTIIEGFHAKRAFIAFAPILIFAGLS